MAETVRASVLHGPRDLRIEDRQLEPPGHDEVQVAIRATGLCGSDIHYYQDYRNGDIQVQEPLILGHESAGIVTEVGENVYNLRVGDPVALEVGLPCGRCPRCREGRYNICKDLTFRSSAKSLPHTQGTLQERINHPAIRCYKLPRGVHVTMGALLEPLSVGIHAFRRAQLNSKSRPKVLILGAGAIGLCCAAVCRYNEAAITAIADVQSERLNLASAFGFASNTLTIPDAKGESLEQNIENAKNVAKMACELQERTSDGFDVVFECTGSEACSQAAIYASRPGGKVVIVGMGTPNQTLPLSAAALREVDIMGSFRYANTYSTAIELMSKPRANFPGLHALITHSFQGLEMVQSAFETASKPHDEHGKMVVKTIVTFDGPANDETSE